MLCLYDTGAFGARDAVFEWMLDNGLPAPCPRAYAALGTSVASSTTSAATSASFQLDTASIAGGAI